jgi:hypothetical protein
LSGWPGDKISLTGVWLNIWYISVMPLAGNAYGVLLGLREDLPSCIYFALCPLAATCRMVGVREPEAFTHRLRYRSRGEVLQVRYGSPEFTCKETRTVVVVLVVPFLLTLSYLDHIPYQQDNHSHVGSPAAFWSTPNIRYMSASGVEKKEVFEYPSRQLARE